MKAYKLTYLFLLAALLLASCKDTEDPALAYIGQWNLVDASGEGTVTIRDLGSEFDSKIIFESSDAYMMIKEDNTLEMKGELIVLMEVYLGTQLLSSESVNLGDSDSQNVWSLDENDNFQSPEFDEDVITFDGNIMTLASAETIDSAGIISYQELELVFERNQ